MPIDLHVALIHYPVVNKHNEIIASAITNLDLHDIARASRTYGVSGYWIVTPDAQQKELARQILGHWTEGYGGTVNPDRAEALSLARIRNSVGEVIEEISSQQTDKKRPLLIATSAGDGTDHISFSDLKKVLSGGQSVLLLFGTAWGLALDLLEQVDMILPPIKGPGDFNHLSVRSAVSIILDRLCGIR